MSDWRKTLSVVAFFSDCKSSEAENWKGIGWNGCQGGRATEKFGDASNHEKTIEQRPTSIVRARTIQRECLSRGWFSPGVKAPCENGMGRDGGLARIKNYSRSSIINLWLGLSRSRKRNGRRKETILCEYFRAISNSVGHTWKHQGN